MSLMSPEDRQKLAERFETELVGDVAVRVRAHPGACLLCSRAEAILREMTALSKRLTLSVESGEGALPETSLHGAARGEVRFVGLPAGHEFPAFIDSVVEVSSGRTTLSPEARERLAAIETPVEIQVFTTPT